MYSVNKAFLVVIPIVLLICFVSYLFWEKAQKIDTDENGALQALQLISLGEQQQRLNHKKYVSLGALKDDLRRDGIEPFLFDEATFGYRFEVRVNEPGTSFESFATPTEYQKTGRRSFYLDPRGVTYAADKQGGQATPDDPTVK